MNQYLAELTFKVPLKPRLKQRLVKKILVIEDSLFIRENAVMMLKLAGYEVMEAENGRKGLLLAKMHLPDLIICDIMMPVLDGYGVLEGLLQDPVTARIPFIFLTAKISKTDQETGLESGAAAYITKPFNEDSLLETVAFYLKKYSKPDQN